MTLEELLNMDGHSAIDWLVENKMDFELTKKPMFSNIEEFEDAVGYKVNPAFREGFGVATMPKQ